MSRDHSRTGHFRGPSGEAFVGGGPLGQGPGRPVTVTGPRRGRRRRGVRCGAPAGGEPTRGLQGPGRQRSHRHGCRLRGPQSPPPPRPSCHGRFSVVDSRGMGCPSVAARYRGPRSLFPRAHREEKTGRAVTSGVPARGRGAPSRPCSCGPQGGPLAPPPGVICDPRSARSSLSLS